MPEIQLKKRFQTGTPTPQYACSFSICSGAIEPSAVCPTFVCSGSTGDIDTSRNDTRLTAKRSRIRCSRLRPNHFILLIVPPIDIIDDGPAVTVRMHLLLCDMKPVSPSTDDRHSPARSTEDHPRLKRLSRPSHCAFFHNSYELSRSGAARASSI